jgi:molybdopterin adenylyltransferase
VIRCAILTISDSARAGTREDRSGPALEARAEELGCSVVEKRLLGDEAAAISATIVQLADRGDVDLILTTGGTGVAPRDVTPEAVREIAQKEIPGFGELMRAHGMKTTKFAPLSRSGAYTRRSTLIVTLPGSPRGAVDSLDAVAGLIQHVVDLIHGRTEHPPKPLS